MMEYKLYRLDDLTHHIVSARRLVAQSDLDALQQAEDFCESDTVELWHGARRIALLQKGNAAPQAPARISL